MIFNVENGDVFFVVVVVVFLLPGTGVHPGTVGHSRKSRGGSGTGLPLALRRLPRRPRTT